MTQTILETERLILKPTDPDDAEMIFWVMNSPKWLKYIGDRKIRTVQDAANYIEQKITPQQERLGFGNNTVFRKSDRVKMGSCGLYDRSGLEGVDIGFAFLPEFEKKGYAFEAANKVKEAAFGIWGQKKISAITIKENTDSQKLLEKLGLTFEKYVTLPDDPEELMYYALEAPKENE